MGKSDTQKKGRWIDDCCAVVHQLRVDKEIQVAYGPFVIIRRSVSAVHQEKIILLQQIPLLSCSFILIYFECHGVICSYSYFFRSKSPFSVLSQRFLFSAFFSWHVG